MKPRGFLLLLSSLFFVVSCGESNKNNKGIVGRINTQSNPASASPTSNGETRTNPAPTGLPSGTSGSTEKHEMLQFSKNCVITVTDIDLTTNPNTPKFTIIDTEGHKNTITVNIINDDDAVARGQTSNGFKVGNVADSNNKAVYVILSKVARTQWAISALYNINNLVIRFIADGLDSQTQFDIAAELKANGPLKLKFRHDGSKYYL
jgi:hypothetical protein